VRATGQNEAVWNERLQEKGQGEGGPHEAEAVKQKVLDERNLDEPQHLQAKHGGEYQHEDDGIAEPMVDDDVGQPGAVRTADVERLPRDAAQFAEAAAVDQTLVGTARKQERTEDEGDPGDKNQPQDADGYPRFPFVQESGFWFDW